jgi:hypothetical protein
MSGVIVTALFKTCKVDADNCNYNNETLTRIIQDRLDLIDQLRYK